MKIVLATQNKGKLKEIKRLLSGLDIKMSSALQEGIAEKIKEDGKTFKENALKKARYIAKVTKQWSVADDSGLCIKALNNQPGLKTARWAGVDKRDNDLVAFTLTKMKDIPPGKRQAFFISTVALVSPNGKSLIFEGRVDGKIAQRPRGTKRPSLPYDLIFIPDGFTKTFAQMSDRRKNSLSHRGLAFAKLKKFLSLKEPTE